MSDFLKWKGAIQKKLTLMTKHEMFRSNANKDLMVDTYLKSFPEGTNPVYRENTEHDCTCCKQFIRASGDALAIIDGKLVSIWDVKIGGHYQVVTDAMSKFVKSNGIHDLFLSPEAKLGTDSNREFDENNKVVNTWDHFYFKLPVKFVNNKTAPGKTLDSVLGDKRETKNVFKRGMTEISKEAMETTLELIDGGLYRGAEFKSNVQKFLKEKILFDKQRSNIAKERFCWLRSSELGGFARLRNSAIGTLMVDLANGVEIDKAIHSFGTKLDPLNYKRSKAPVTATMVAKAEETVNKLGILEALPRRFAVARDVTVNNVIFADRSVKPKMKGASSIFEEMKQEAPAKAQTKNVEEVSIDNFLTKVIPEANGIEVLFENEKANNLMSLIAPVDAEAPSILEWDNNFSWSYNGEVTDSIKERVKKAGGNVSGVLRWSLSWFNNDDLDIHVIEPNKNHIGFEDKSGHASTGELDVDMNDRLSNMSRNAVENITWADKRRMQEGLYTVFIHNYQARETADVGFTVEMEFEGVTHTFNYNRAVGNKAKVEVATFRFTRKDGIKFVKSIPSTHAARDVWGVKTNSYQKVKMVVQSPNHWDSNESGNKHWFFILEGCNNPKEARGFYNEFLRKDLTEHRKVFELMSSKMKTPKSDEQLSGLGFSSTQKNSITCRVSGEKQRVYKVNF